MRYTDPDFIMNVNGRNVSLVLVLGFR